MSSTLVVPLSNCEFMDEDVYIVNPQSVIYENCTTRKYIFPDMSSFRFPKRNENGFFALDKNGVYFRGDFIKTDTTGFELIGVKYDYTNTEVLWKTNTNIYKNSEIVIVSDVASFEPIECYNGSYFRDKDFVYYFDKKIEGSDGLSVSKSCDNSCFDKYNYYLDGKILRFENEKVMPVNKSIVKTSKYVLSKDFQKLNMDVKTLVAFSDSYTMDKDFVYYETEKLAIKPINFKNVKVWEQVNSAYISDGLKIYFRDGNVEPNFDAKTFGMLPHSDFCYDKNGIYEREWVEKLDDVINVKFPFNYKNKVTSENTFITDDSSYIIYENQAYDPWRKILYENLTKEQLKLAKENRLVLSKNMLQRTLVEKKFDDLLIKKGNKIYWDNKETRADASSFVQLNYYYYKDKNHVFYYDIEKGLIILKGIDTNTTTIFNEFLKDATNIYCGKVRILKNKDTVLLAVFAGYRQGCSQDSQYPSNYYLFKNTEGYWLVSLSNEVLVRKLGNSLDIPWNENLKCLEIQ
ncbi:DKNYY domain-containing protein [Flavobacterium ardleyense]|uniref:DKNYY domain-containing protein n=1 Tax=Flavobacterium ardleyense TaxID=2038737 RepID=A0ABW5ZCA9_9FLAO